MDISVFEAVAAYDMSKVNSSDIEFPVRSLIIDIDSYSAGLCSCGNNGKFQITDTVSLGENESFERDFASCLAEILNEFDRYRTREYWTEHKKEINASAEIFFRSGGQIDNIILKETDYNITASQFEKSFSPIKEKIIRLTELFFKMFTKNSVDEDSLRIIIAGDYSDCLFADYYIKSEMMFDPFFADERFVNSSYTDNPTEIIKIGKQKLRSKSVFGYDISFRYYNATNDQCTEKILSEKEQDKKLFENPDYSEPVFISADDSLKIEINSTVKEFKLPYNISAPNFDVIQLALGIFNDKPVLLLRRICSPENIYSIPIVST